MAILLICTIFISAISITVKADTLVKEDFLSESFSKTVDFFDYARAYATLNGIPTPAGFENDHAYLCMNYINTSGQILCWFG